MASISACAASHWAWISATRASKAGRSGLGSLGGALALAGLPFPPASAVAIASAIPAPTIDGLGIVPMNVWKPTLAKTLG
eukprot:scaffold694_cov338-Pavlova_lutheri.AAC.5